MKLSVKLSNPGFAQDSRKLEQESLKLDHSSEIQIFLTSKENERKIDLKNRVVAEIN